MTTNNTKETIDDCFNISKTRWNTWRSETLEGEGLVTALSRELCIEHTRFYLRGRQEGWDSLACSVHSGTVDGKL